MSAHSISNILVDFLGMLDSFQLNFDKSQLNVVSDKYALYKPTCDYDKKSALEQSIRQYLLKLIKTPDIDIKVIENYISLCVELCMKDMCNSTLPIILLSDTFDMSTLDKCEQLFYYVEVNVNIWKQQTFFMSCKNNLLRMCNDLLRRLSRSQNTVFCGRILLFLAKFFPFSERSGLNIISEFNVENITEFGGDEEMDVSSNETEETDTEEVDKVKIDFNFYKKFWSLQDYFRNPVQCYNKVSWKMFTSYAETVLAAFKSYKLDDVQSSLNPSGDYFAKYLTNQKLLDLQLSDTNFRRYVLLQFLILFQYFTSTVKSRGEGLELKSDQEKWVKDTTETVYSLIKQTPPDGEHFSQVVKLILKGEEHWNQWKNEGCPELKRPLTSITDEDKKDEPDAKKKKTSKLPGDMLKEAYSQGKVLMGNPELTKLWNSKDNLEACKSAERDFTPSLESYFEEAIQQMDPAAAVEEQYKKVNDSNYAWRALRLLSRKCPHFFLNATPNVEKNSEFIENMVKRCVKEKPSSQISGNGNGVDQDPAEVEVDTKSEEIQEEEKEEDWEAKADPEGDADGEFFLLLSLLLLLFLTDGE
ncbi:THO complex subunit 1 [Diaphorina citri]|uniref:THO complex subunit 1 n=1 Tax=Diaphorina citri TaxID=121845 RepID=A0A1S4E6I3_DIACI|nr:THO complex subunit 1 [Diaphorina citri]